MMPIIAHRAGCRWIATLCTVALAVVTGPVFAAVNLLANPGFDSDLAGWTNRFGRTVSWSPLDAANSASSGSALAVNDSPGSGGTPLTLYQCVTVEPSTTYSFGGRLKVPAGQPPFTYAQVFVQAFASGDCSGEALEQHAVQSTTVEVWEGKSLGITTGPTIHSAYVAFGVSKDSGVTETASGYFDKLFLQQGEVAAGFTIGPPMSATWYNPAESGHGVMVHLLDAESAWMCWFTFDLAGNRAWICSLGTVAGDTLDFSDAFVVEGGNFPPLFDASRIVEVPWGRITVTFTGCDAGTMTWTTGAAGFQSGSMPIARLTPLWFNPCS